ncbi:MAG: hypothetical protein GY754_33170 [bacterium]|nr:hypothetical protein [bacterium]
MNMSTNSLFSCFILFFFTIISCFNNNLLSDGGKSSDNDIISFTLPSGALSTGIDPANHTVHLTVSADPDLSALTPGIIISDHASITPASNETINFSSGPVIYTITAENGRTQVWQVSITKVLNSSKEIQSFLLPAAGNDVLDYDWPGSIDESNHNITVQVPHNTTASALKAQFVSTGNSVTAAGVPQTSGSTEVNFSSPVTYRVTASDGSYQDYTVTVTPKAASTWTGDCIISSADDIKALSSCTMVTGNLAIGGNPASPTEFTSLNGLKNLSVIGGSLLISYNNKLANLDGLQNLSSIQCTYGIYAQYGVYIFENPSLESISGLNSLTLMTRDLVIYANSILANLDGLGGLSSVERLHIYQHSSLENINGLSNITSVTSTLKISDNEILPGLGLDALTLVESNFTVEDNPALCTNIVEGLRDRDGMQINGFIKIEDNKTCD